MPADIYAVGVATVAAAAAADADVGARRCRK